jgi:hypothetical protein
VLREVEYGTGTVHWLEAGAWRSAPIAAGDLDAAWRAE